MKSPSVSALSWKIATEPKLYRELAVNPFAIKALHLISEKFPDWYYLDVIHAVVLAEPEGKYDRDFKQLPQTIQEIELHKQTIAIGHAINRLKEYLFLYRDKLQELSENLIYDTLFSVAFETTSLPEVNQRYSQNQRKEIKLSILNLLTDVTPVAKRQLIVRKPGKTFVKVVVTVLPAVLFFYLGFVFLEPQIVREGGPAEARQVLSVEAQAAVRSLPVRLKIPSLNIDANIQDIGLTTGGAMDVPSNTIEVGWYNLGPSPGEVGNAVITGHLDSVNGKQGVFGSLDKLKPGDKIEIINDQGTTIFFVVRESRTYDPGYAPEVFVSEGNGKHLNLITCEGIWDKKEKSYSKRLVVFADIL